MKKLFGLYFVAMPLCWLIMWAIADTHDWRTAFATFGVVSMGVFSLVGGMVLFDAAEKSK